MLGVLEKEGELIHVCAKSPKSESNKDNLTTLTLFWVVVQPMGGFTSSDFLSRWSDVVACSAAASSLQPIFLLKPIIFASQLFDYNLAVSLLAIFCIHIKILRINHGARKFTLWQPNTSGQVEIVKQVTASTSHNALCSIYVYASFIESYSFLNFFVCVWWVHPLLEYVVVSLTPLF